MEGLSYISEMLDTDTRREGGDRRNEKALL